MINITPLNIQKSELYEINESPIDRELFVYIIMNSEAEFKYWCYSCEKHFQQTVPAESCQLCHSPAIELTENNTGDPSNFQVYEIAGNRV